MKKQKSYHWHFIIALSILAVIFSALLIREITFFGADRFVQKAITEKNASVDRIVVECVKFDPIELKGNETERFINALDYIKVRKATQFDTEYFWGGNAKYHWIIGNKNYEYDYFYKVSIDFYSGDEIITRINTRESESLYIDGVGSFFLKTPIYMDDIFAIAMACKN